MPVCFSSEKPRNCCCGCSIECGVWTFTILCALDAILQICAGAWTTSITSLIPAVTGLCALLMKDNITMRLVNYYVWLVLAVIAGIFMLLLLVAGNWLMGIVCG